MSLHRLDRKFGVLPKLHRSVTDHSRRLSPGDTLQVKRLLTYFETKFPQSLFSVYLTHLQPGTSISEYHFWLFNRARLRARLPSEEMNFNILLLVDFHAEAAALGIGYGLEPYLAEQDLALVLEAAKPAFAAGAIEEAIRICVEAMMERMRGVAREVDRASPAKFLRRRPALADQKIE